MLRALYCIILYLPYQTIHRDHVLLYIKTGHLADMCYGHLIGRDLIRIVLNLPRDIRQSVILLPSIITRLPYLI